MSDKEEMLRSRQKNIQIFLQRLRPRGLQAHMTISYVWVTVAAVLVLESLAVVLNGISPGISPWQFTGRLTSTLLVSLLIAAPIGGLFGLITPRGLVRRLHTLVGASTRFANGDYTQHLQVRHSDEVGQLEHQF